MRLHFIALHKSVLIVENIKYRGAKMKKKSALILLPRDRHTNTVFLQAFFFVHVFPLIYILCKPV